MFTRDFNGATWTAWGSLGGGAGTVVDLASSGSTGSTFSIQATNGSGTGVAVTIPAATVALAGMLTATDKAKLDALPVGFLGPFASLAALATAHPTGAAGEFAILTNPAGDPTFGIWDSDAGPPA